MALPVIDLLLLTKFYLTVMTDIRIRRLHLRPARKPGHLDIRCRFRSPLAQDRRGHNPGSNPNDRQDRDTQYRELGYQFRLTIRGGGHVIMTDSRNNLIITGFKVWLRRMIGIQVIYW